MGKNGISWYTMGFLIRTISDCQSFALSSLPLCMISSICLLHPMHILFSLSVHIPIHGVSFFISLDVLRSCSYMSHQCLHAFSMIARHVTVWSMIQNVLMVSAILTSFCVIGKNCGLSSSVTPIGIPTTLDHKINHFPIDIWLCMWYK